MRIALSGVTVAVLVVNAACIEITEPGLVLSLDATSYVATPVAPGSQDVSFRIIASYTNTGRRVAAVTRCDPGSNLPMYAVLTIKGESAYNAVWACTGAPAIPLNPGTTRVDTFSIIGPIVTDGITNEPIGALEGTFYLVIAGSPPAQSRPFTVTISR